MWKTRGKETKNQRTRHSLIPTSKETNTTKTLQTRSCSIVRRFSHIQKALIILGWVCAAMVLLKIKTMMTHSHGHGKLFGFIYSRYKQYYQNK